MGLGATQARLLTLTSRVSSTEYAMEKIANQKIRLTMDQEEVSKKYAEKLNNYTVKVYDGADDINGHALGNADIKRLYNQADVRFVKASDYLAASEDKNFKNKMEKTRIYNECLVDHDTMGAEPSQEAKDAYKAKYGIEFPNTLSAEDYNLVPLFDANAASVEDVASMLTSGYLVMINANNEAVSLTSASINSAAIDTLNGYSESTYTKKVKTTSTDGEGNVTTKMEEATATKTEYTGMTMIQTLDTSDDAAAEAEYNQEMAKINRKEKMLDKQRTALDIEHTAMNTEINNLKTMISNNVKSFQLFG